MDFIMPLPMTDQGHDALLVIVDRLSRYTILIPTVTTITAVDTAHLFYDHIFRHFGMPTSIVSDRDVRFTSMFWQELFDCLGTNLRLSSAYHPQTNGLTERTNRTIEQLLRNLINPDLTDWDQHLSSIQFCINSTENASTKISPMHLLYGHEPRQPTSLIHTTDSPLPTVSKFLNSRQQMLQEAKSKLASAQLQQKQSADKSRRDISFQVNDKVLLSTLHTPLNAGPAYKLTARYSGPFTISKVVNPVSYELKLPTDWTIHPVFHASQLQPYHESTKFHDRIQTTPIPTRQERSLKKQEFDVEDLLDYRIITTNRSKHPTYQYLVKWTDFTHDDNSWEPWSLLSRDTRKIVQAKNYPMPGRHSTRRGG
jgi:transposase InsO family protein